MKIFVTEIPELVEIVSGLVREGIMFEVKHYDDNSWVIVCTGGN